LKSFGIEGGGKRRRYLDREGGIDREGDIDTGEHHRPKGQVT
jgi:hypothetical protein